MQKVYRNPKTCVMLSVGQKTIREMLQMLTIKSLGNGQNAVYVRNDASGLRIIERLLQTRQHAFYGNGDCPSFRITPLSQDRIAAYFKNNDVGRGLVIAMLSEFSSGCDDEELVYEEDEEESLCDDEDPVSKICSKCGVEKPLDQFYASKDGYLGRRADCIECNRKADADRRNKRRAEKEVRRRYLAR